MTQTKRLAVVTIATMALGACGSKEAEQQAMTEVELATSAPEVAFKSSEPELGDAVGTPNSPYRVSYRIIGTPVIGSPVTVDLQVDTGHSPKPMRLDYRINDATSMLLGASQPASVSLDPAANEASFSQQVTIIPQREGRFYLNVSASYESANGTMSTVTAIPIQVGSGTRELQEHGEVQIDENGEAVRVLSSD